MARPACEPRHARFDAQAAVVGKAQSRHSGPATGWVHMGNPQGGLVSTPRVRLWAKHTSPAWHFSRNLDSPVQDRQRKVRLVWYGIGARIERAVLARVRRVRRTATVLLLDWMEVRAGTSSWRHCRSLSGRAQRTPMRTVDVACCTCALHAGRCTLQIACLYHARCMLHACTSRRMRNAMRRLRCNSTCCHELYIPEMVRRVPLRALRP